MVDAVTVDRVRRSTECKMPFEEVGLERFGCVIGGWRIRDLGCLANWILGQL